MSDYLDSLVARSLGTANIVQPRPLSLFEPLQPAVSFVGDNSSAEEDHVQAEMPASTAIPMEPPGETRTETMPKPGKITSSSIVELPGMPPPDHSGSPTIHVGTSQPSTLLTPRPPVMPDAEIVDISNRAHRSEYSAGWRTLNREREVPKKPPSDVMTPGKQHSSAVYNAGAPIAAQPPEASATASAARTLLVAPMPLPSGEREGLKGGSPVRAAAPRSAPDTTRDAAPTIRITIGRVDVRAMRPENRTSPAPERRPALSLEDYLRERSGGKQ